MQKLWLYLYFPQLQLDTLLQQSCAPQDKQHAYVIVEPEKNHICQLNKKAYQGGIRQGMGLGTAAMLMQDINVLPYQPKIENSVLKEIAQRLYLVTSDIAFYKEHGLLLQIHNMLPMYGGLLQYWQQIQQGIPAHLNYYYATGLTPLAARLLALTQYNKVSDCTQTLNQAVKPINLSHTELAESVVEKLKRVGIHTLENLLIIPFAELAKRFDSQVTTYIGKLTQLIPHPINFFHPQQHFSHYMELLFDVEHVKVLLKPISSLLTLLEEYLKHRDLLTNSITVELYQRDNQPLHLIIQARQGEYLARNWLALLQLKVDGLRFSAPVYALNLSTEHTYIRTPDKPDLFSHKQGALNQLQLLSILQAKLGEQALIKPKLANDFRPELMSHNHSHINKTETATLTYPMRPSFLLTPPLVLQEKVTIAYGPERIDTAWWQGVPIIRDYFIAYNPSGKWYWIYKTVDGKWYLHGVFS